MQRKDPTEFRRRFLLYKEGKMPYENGLPKYDTGKDSEYADEYFGPLGQYTNQLVDFIVQHEGFEPNKMGKDPVTGVDYIGSGIELPEYINLFNRTGVWSEQDNRGAIKEITSRYTPNLMKTFGKVWDKLTPLQKIVLYDVAYNIGVEKLNSTNSPKFVAAVLAGDNEEAKRLMDWGNHLARGLINRNNDRKALWDSGYVVNSDLEKLNHTASYSQYYNKSRTEVNRNINRIRKRWDGNRRIINPVRKRW